MSIKNIQELNVGLNGAVGFKPIVIKQYDKNTRRIEITLLEGSDVFEIPTGSVAKFQATKPDGTIIFDDCVIENEMVVYKAIEDLSTCAGTVKCEVGLYNSVGDELLQSSTFNIVVEESAMDRNAVASSNEFNTLTIMINTITGLVDRAEITLGEIDTAISNAETATNNANQSATNAQQATATIVSTNQTITDSENTRIASENTRKSSEITRQSQETTRQTNTSTAVTKADAATTRANLAAKSCEDIASGIIQLPDIGTANTYTKVTTDTKGRVISGSTPTAIADLGITNVYTKTEIDTKTNDINTSLGNQIGTAQGSNINLPNTFNGGLFLKELQGKTVDTGVPSVATPSTSVNVGDSGSVVLGSCGKNFVDINTMDKTPNLNSATVVGDTITLNASANKNSAHVMSRRIVLKKGTYTMSTESIEVTGSGITSATGLFRVQYYDDSNTYIGIDLDKDARVKTFTLDKDRLVYLILHVAGGVAVTTDVTVKFTKVMLELNTSKSTYEQYKGQNITIPTPQPWRSVNTAYDRPIKKDGVWGVERNIIRVVFDGSYDEFIGVGTTNTTGKKRCMITPTISAKPSASQTLVSEIYCDKFKAVSPNATYTLNDGICCDTSGFIFIYYEQLSGYTTSQEFRTWLALNPITITYQLKTPTFEPFTQSIQDALNKLQSYNGVTNMFTTDAQQPVILVEYGKTDTAALSIYANNIYDSKLDKAMRANNEVTNVEGYYLDAMIGAKHRKELDALNNNLTNLNSSLTKLRVGNDTNPVEIPIRDYTFVIIVQGEHISGIDDMLHSISEYRMIPRVGLGIVGASHGFSFLSLMGDLRFNGDAQSLHIHTTNSNAWFGVYGLN